jgi:plasmid maintenance system antidote protein VapI
MQSDPTPPPPLDPALAYHPSEFIVEEMEARGWSRWDLAKRMGGDRATNRLALDLYIETGPTAPGLLIGGVTARQLGKAFGVSPKLFLNLEAAWRASNAE